MTNSSEPIVPCAPSKENSDNLSDNELRVDKPDSQDCSDSIEQETTETELSDSRQHIAPASASTESILAGLNTHKDELNSLKKLFEEKIAYDESKQKQIDRLHSELVEHRQNLVNKTARPLVNGLIRLHEDLGRILDKYQHDNSAQISPEKCLKLLDGVQEDIEILLDQNGVSSFCLPNEKFDPRKQSVVKNIPTESPEKVGLVAQKIRPGFEQGEELIKKEKVSVYVKKAATNKPETSFNEVSKDPQINKSPQTETVSDESTQTSQSRESE